MAGWVTQTDNTPYPYVQQVLHVRIVVNGGGLFSANFRLNDKIFRRSVRRPMTDTPAKYFIIKFKIGQVSSLKMMKLLLLYNLGAYLIGKFPFDHKTSILTRWSLFCRVSRKWKGPAREPSNYTITDVVIQRCYYHHNV